MAEAAFGVSAAAAVTGSFPALADRTTVFGVSSPARVGEEDETRALALFDRTTVAGLLAVEALLVGEGRLDELGDFSSLALSSDTLLVVVALVGDRFSKRLLRSATDDFVSLILVVLLLKPAPSALGTYNLCQALDLRLRLYLLNLVLLPLPPPLETIDDDCEER